MDHIITVKRVILLHPTAMGLRWQKMYLPSLHAHGHTSKRTRRARLVNFLCDKGRSRRGWMRGNRDASRCSSTRPGCAAAPDNQCECSTSLEPLQRSSPIKLHRILRKSPRVHPMMNVLILLYLPRTAYASFDHLWLYIIPPFLILPSNTTSILRFTLIEKILRCSTPLEKRKKSTSNFHIYNITNLVIKH